MDRRWGKTMMKQLIEEIEYLVKISPFVAIKIDGKLL
jgi:hypothetical protein